MRNLLEHYKGALMNRALKPPREQKLKWLDMAERFFETNSTLELNIQVTDAGGLSYTEAVSVTVNDVSENPTALNLTVTSIDENNAADAVVFI